MKFGISNEVSISDYLLALNSSLRLTWYLAFIVSIFINLLMLTAPIYMLQVFDRVILAKSLDTLVYITILAASFLLLYAVLEIIRMKIMQKCAAWFSDNIKAYAIYPIPINIVNGSKYTTSAIRDIDVIKQFISSSGASSFFDAPFTPFYLVLVYTLHPYLGAISTVGGIILIILAIVNELISRKLVIEASTINSNNLQKLDTAFRNYDVIYAFGMIGTIISTFMYEDKIATIKDSKAKFINSVLTFSSRFVRYLMQILMLGCGAYLVINNEITPGMMIASSIVMSRALAPIEQLIGTWHGYVMAQDAYERISEHLLSSEFPKDKTSLPTPRGKICVENLAYAPPNWHEMIIKHLTFSIQAGDLLTIIGPSAAGKTTLAKLLVGIYPPSVGEVRLDDVAIYDWDHIELGPHIGYLPQNVELFEDSIAMNIARLVEHDDNDVIEAAKLANAFETILSLPNGFDTIVGRECKLSGGQLQRIGLARALYKKPKYIVLDEPHAHLDTKGEQDLIETLEQLKKEKITTIIIAYHPHVIEHSDKLLFLDQGEIKVFGPTAKVLAKLKEQNK